MFGSFFSSSCWCGESCLIYVIYVCLHIVVCNIYCIARCFCFVFLRPKKRYIIWFDWLIFGILTPLSAIFSAIPWRPVLVMEEAGVPEENHRPWASNWYTLSLGDASRVHPFCDLQSRARSHAVVVMVLYEMLGNELGTHWATRALILFDFPIFWFWAYLMKIIPETSRTH